MYRVFNKKEIAKFITTYSGANNKKRSILSKNDRDILNFYYKRPTAHSLIRILKNRDVSENMKKIITCLIDGINYSSIKPYIKNEEEILWNILGNADLCPMWSLQEAELIATYVQYKGLNTGVLNRLQIEDVRNRLKNLGYIFELSKTGSTDIRWTSDESGADGLIKANNTNIYLYLRYGTSSGGSQNDRYRSMGSTSVKHLDNSFIFIVDGMEALLETNVILKFLEKYECKNAIWSTASMLHRIDIDNFKLIRNI